MADENDDVDEGQEDFETEARALGWQPEEEFKGDKSRFIPAKEFVEKGRHVVPILQQNNKRLQGELLTRDKKIGKLEQDLKNLSTSFDEVEKRLSKVDQAAFVRAKAQLVAELKAAREEGNVDAEVAVQDKMEQLRKAAEDDSKEVKKKPIERTEPTPVELDPVLQEWMKKNTWFGNQNSPEDKKRTKEFLRIREDMIDDGFTGTMAEAIAEVERQYAQRHPTKQTPSKVEGGARGSNGSGGSAGKGYASLPADAKHACMEFADAVVGPGKRYKTVEEWQKKYAKDYFDGEQ